MTITPITLADLTTTKVGGSGVFDQLMACTVAHLDQEYRQQRIKGTEYSTVYLGSLQATMSTAMQFLLSRQKIDLEAQLLEQQILLAQVEVLKANAAVDLMKQQVLNAKAELDIIIANKGKIAAEISQLDAQTALTNQQKANLTAEAVNIPKQGLILDAQYTHTNQQTQNLLAEKLNIPKQGDLIDAQKGQVIQTTTNLVAEGLNIPKQGQLIDANKAQVTQNTLNLTSEKLGIEARTALTTQQKANAVIEGTVLVAQECKLRAEYDLILGQKLKTAQETSLLAQKIITERAQVQSSGIDPGSVVGKQIALYGAQTEGFKRDAEQKAAKIMVDTWNARRMTDEATSANASNKLDDATVGRTIDKMIAGISA